MLIELIGTFRLVNHDEQCESVVRGWRSSSVAVGMHC